VVEQMMARFIGEKFSWENSGDEFQGHVATIFPYAKVIVTVPGIHATQRLAYIDTINDARAKEGKPRLTEDEELAIMVQSVDLFVRRQGVFIRPDAEQMELAFAADEVLQEVVPGKRLIKYLNLDDRRVRDSLKLRGDCWRIFLPPIAPQQIRQMISEARCAIGGRPIYYYSPVTGTRWLTYQNLCGLVELDDAELRRHLAEIAKYMDHENHNRYPEIDFFMADSKMCLPDLKAIADGPADELRARFGALCQCVRQAVPAAYQRDDLDEPIWFNRMFSHLITQRDDALVDDQTMGLDPDFSMRVEWLPGARIEQGELILDPAMDEPACPGSPKNDSSVVRGLIFNLVQDYGDLEYINIGSVLPSATRNPRRGGRREVYVAQIKQRRATVEVLQIIRMQKWGVRERLDEGLSLEQAMSEAEEYTQYVRDRRLACRQLQMNVPHRMTAHKVSEKYDGKNRKYAGTYIWTPYFQRDYLAGVATNQVSSRKLGDAAYAMTFARLLGQAAASNIILGRAELVDKMVGEVVFDVGDEIVVEDAAGMPVDIVVSDQVGTFVDWKGNLEMRAPEYAACVNRRLNAVTMRKEFIESFLSGFVERFIRTQEEYNRNRRAFDTLFNHRPWDEGGSLSCRWSNTMQRLTRSNAGTLADLIRAAVNS
jgi:hypothetical protein